MSLSTSIKTIQNIMRKDAGVDGDAQRISQLTWLLFLKIFDGKEEELELLMDEEEEYHSPIPEELRWRNWATDDEGITGDELMNFVNNELFPRLKELRGDEKSRLVRSVFEDTYNYMKSGTLLRAVINEIEKGIQMDTREDRHQMNDIYEKILKDLQSAGNAGEFYTPRAVTQFIVERTNPQLGEQVLDPACGTAGFLVDAIEHIRRNVDFDSLEVREQLQNTVRGVEKKPLPHMLAVTNLMLHGIDVPKIAHDNLLMESYKKWTDAHRVDVIVANPPFGGMEEDGIERNLPSDFQTRETADLFLWLFIHLLKDGGRAGIVLPDGSLFGEGMKTRLKEKLLTECNLHTIVRLPKGVFAPYTSINTNLLFFTKGEPTREVWYYEHPYPPGYKSYSKGKPIRIEEFEPEKQWWDKRKENRHAWKVSIEEIQKRNYNLDIKNPHSEEEDLGDPEELLREYRELEAKVAEMREALKNELTQSFISTVHGDNI
ncbi:MAG: N-6 DNA methylase [Lewinellaceae bacterium]|nr:N-6 DNA methylase [Lewinellaceae bacterium]